MAQSIEGMDDKAEPPAPTAAPGDMLIEDPATPTPEPGQEQVEVSTHQQDSMEEDDMDEEDVCSDISSLMSDDDYVEVQPTNFGQFVVIFGSRRKARRRARHKHKGTQWECELCAQSNCILDSVCSACGIMDLDLLELGEDDQMASLRREAEEERNREQEEKERKERAARIAKSKQIQQKRSNIQEMQNSLEEMRRLLKQKEQSKKGKGEQSPQPTQPLTPGKPGPTGVVPPPMPALTLTPTAKPPAVTEGPQLPPHLLAARRARETQVCRRFANNTTHHHTTQQDDDDKRDRRRRSDDDTRRRERGAERDHEGRREGRERRRRTDERERDPRDRRDKTRREERRPSIEGLKSLISSTVDEPAPRLSGTKRMLSPEPNRYAHNHARRLTTTPLFRLSKDRKLDGKARMEHHADDRSRSRSPPTKRGRGSSKWTGSRDRWEDGEERVAMATSASGKKIFQARGGGSESLLKREHDEKQKRERPQLSTSLAGPSRPAGPEPVAAKRSLKDQWREKLNSAMLEAIELSPGHDATKASTGIVHHIATCGGTKPWVNPYTEGLINASASSTGRGHIGDVLSPSFGSECCFATAQDTNKHAYVAFDFGEWEILPYQYTLGHAFGYATNYMRSWSLRASEDNSKWDTLSRHSNDDTLNAGNDVGTYKLAPRDSMKFYRYFMIRLEPKVCLKNVENRALKILHESRIFVEVSFAR